MSSVEQLIEQIAGQTNDRARRMFLRRNRELRNVAVVRRLYEEVARRARADVDAAERFARAAAVLAGWLKDPVARAYSLRADGHICFIRGKQEPALARYKAALKLFERAGLKQDVGRTLNGALQTLIYLGRYQTAFAWAQRARKIFAGTSDRLRLARLDTNLGNILYRQDRFEEALERYRSAAGELRRLGEPQDVAAVLSNIAVCYISLNDFPAALNAYHEARNYCYVHNLPLFVVQADYNVAYLYYLRGEYTNAIAMYDAARKQAALLEDDYHSALCDLDQAEMNLELNLVEEASELAQRAFVRFSDLKMGYEAAKALAFLAVATSRRGNAARALELFHDARQRFVREQNRVWPALIDLYQALVLFQEMRYGEARRLCEAAYRFFARTSLTTKTVVSELLSARLLLQTGRTRQARARCLSALRKLERIEAPTLRFQGHFVHGQVEEAMGNRARAQEAFERAHAALEGLRSHLRGEELKISFLKDKLAVYESLVWLSLSGNPGRSDFQTAFSYIEFAKSRILADLIAFRAHALPARTSDGDPVVGRVRDLREQLDWYYRQIELRETGGAARTEPLGRLRRAAREHEDRLLRALNEARTTDEEYSSLQSAGAIPLDTIRSAIPSDAMLLEYYEARGTIYVCLVSREKLEIVPLGPASKSRQLLRLLQFQLSKFHFGAEYVRGATQLMHRASQGHLRELYEELIAPVRARIRARHLIVVPHDFLHYLPFHALYDGERFLTDSYLFSYAPSASVYYLCHTKKPPPVTESLVLGVPDPLAPQILGEVRAVASALPQSRLFLGPEASEECLRIHGPQGRFVHIATHGLFRQDNPMFSSLRLGDKSITLSDLYGLRLSAELVTLSGCGTGLNVVVGGDELLGLVRGLLYAGAQALLVTLWDVNDSSTADFMKTFYRQIPNQPNKALALQQAMRELRETHPHPYYWAPFVLIGKVGA